ncbi:VWA domain-containing protein [Photobacterium sp. ZSDE20]|uniref:VWA domain-containing protein n=1 Tax=Photobacterium pectinilyticum TaxID=2906793 RepID=A0ABT1N787_9GAMM|nr:VWA domain-containing protein [Photobacterium sp. ZSDE20]MCQ1060619.1 VWA domain-containing protein [Photobacterium sp. ZSDE20]MDD1827814.1 VWA domain-containing protein [Photobacterium sp. ZSDE20]
MKKQTIKQQQAAQSMLRSMEVISGALAENPVRVEWADGFNAMAYMGQGDDDRRYLAVPCADFRIEHNRKLTEGFLVHEILHHKFTSFASFAESRKDKVADILNALEDPYIESKGAKVLPGAKAKLDYMNQFLIREGYWSAKPTGNIRKDVLFYVLFTLQWARVKTPNTDKLAAAKRAVLARVIDSDCLNKLDLLINVARSSCSTEGNLRAALNINIWLKRVLLKHPPQQGQPSDVQCGDGQQQAGDQQQGDSQSGEGQQQAGDQQQGDSQSGEGQQQAGDQQQGDSQSGDGQQQAGDQQQGDSQSGDGQQQAGDQQQGDSQSGEGQQQGDSQSGDGQQQAGDQQQGDSQSGESQHEPSFPSLSEMSQQLSRQTSMDHTQAILDELSEHAVDIDVEVPLPLAECTSPDNKSRLFPHSVLRASAKGDASRLKRDLNRLVQSKNFTKSTYSRRGVDIAPTELYRGVIDGRVFVEEQIGKAENTAVYLLVDRSPSMGGYSSWMGVAVKATYSLSTALESLKIPYAIGMYPELRHGIILSKGYHERLAGVIDKVNICRGKGGTPTGEAMMAAIRHINKRPERKKLLFIITDGEARCADRVAYATHFAETLGIKTIGIGIGDGIGKESLEHYSTSMLIKESDELAQALSTAMRGLAF